MSNPHVRFGVADGESNLPSDPTAFASNVSPLTKSFSVLYIN
jgi:hypothetical protein